MISTFSKNYGFMNLTSKRGILKYISLVDSHYSFTASAVLQFAKGFVIITCFMITITPKILEK